MVKRKYWCRVCKKEFETEEPQMTIPVSVKWCPFCDRLAERADS